MGVSTIISYGCLKSPSLNICQQCAPGLFLFKHKSILSNDPEQMSYCVPDCHLIPFMKNNYETATCDVCQNQNQQFCQNCSEHASATNCLSKQNLQSRSEDDLCQPPFIYNGQQSQCEIACQFQQQPIYEQIKGLVCETCSNSSLISQNCDECRGNICIQCNAGYYLNTQNNQCVESTQTKKKKKYLILSSQKNLIDKIDIFSQLPGAIQKAYEIGAQNNSIEIFILFTSGMHFLTNSQLINKQYYAKKTAKSSSSFQLVFNTLSCQEASQIKPLFPSLTHTYENICIEDGEMAFINYRAPGFFSISIPHSLEWRNINVSAIDYLNSNCQDQLTQLCKFDQQTEKILSLVQGCPCQSEKFGINYNDCNTPYPLNFFKFDYASKILYESPKSIAVINSRFFDFHYLFNSFIEVPFQQHGQITIKNSEFQRFSSCGSILYNDQIIPQFKSSANSGTVAHSTWIFNYQISKIKKNEEDNQNMQKSCKTPHWDKSFTDVLKISCSFVNIDNSIFSYFDFFISSGNLQEEHSIYGYENKNSWIRGRVILLLSYQGEMRVLNSKFENNLISYPKLLNPHLESKKRIKICSQDILPTDFNGIKIQTLIAVTFAKDEILFYGNSFTNNSGLKGIVYLSRNIQSKKELLIIKNTFIKNSSFYGAATIYAKSLTPKNALSCKGGFFFSRNYFSSNIVFFRPGAILKITCLKFILTTYRVNYLNIDDYPFEYSKISSLAYQYQQIDKYSAIIQNDNLLEDSSSYFTKYKSKIVNNQEYTVYQDAFVIQNSQFYHNVYNQTLSVIQIEQISNILLQDLTFEMNGSVFPDYFKVDKKKRTLMDVYSQNAAIYISEVINVNLPTSVIYMHEIHVAFIKNTKFIKNWSIDKSLTLCGSQILIVNQFRSIAQFQNIKIQQNKQLNWQILTIVLDKLGLEKIKKKISFQNQINYCPLIHLYNQDPQKKYVINGLSISNVSIEKNQDSLQFYGTIFNVAYFSTSIRIEEEDIKCYVNVFNFQIQNGKFTDEGNQGSLFFVTEMFKDFHLINSTFRNIEFDGMGIGKFYLPSNKKMTIQNSFFSNIKTSNCLGFSIEPVNSNQVDTFIFRNLTLGDSQLNQSFISIWRAQMIIKISDLKVYNLTKKTAFFSIIQVESGRYNSIQVDQFQYQINNQIHLLFTSTIYNNFIFSNGKVEKMVDTTYTPYTDNEHLFILNQQLNKLVVVNTTFKNINWQMGKSGIIYSISSSVLQQYSNTYENLSSSQVGGVYLIQGKSIINIYNTTYINCASFYGGVYYIQGTSQVSIYNATFQNCISTFGGVFYISNSVKLLVQNSTFSQCQAKLGGAIINSDQTAIFTFDKCTFQNIDTGIQGYVIYMLGEMGSNKAIKDNFKLKNSIFWNIKGKWSLFAIYFTAIQISNCVFQNIVNTKNNIFLIYNGQYLKVQNSKFTNLKGGAGNVFQIESSKTPPIFQNNQFYDIEGYQNTIYLKQSNIVFSNNSFDNIISLEGTLIKGNSMSRIQIHESIFKNINVDILIAFQKLWSNKEFHSLIQGNTFKNIIHSQGVILLQQSKFIDIIDNKFNNIVGLQRNGAIQVTFLSEYIFIDSNYFFKSSCQEGSALKYGQNVRRESITLTQNIFQENSATVYGLNIASYSSETVFITKNVSESVKETNKIITEDNNDNYKVQEKKYSIEIFDFKSSDIITPLYIGRIDNLGQIVSSQNYHILKMTAESEIQNQIVPTLTGSNPIFSQKGVYSILDLVLTAQPESKVTIKFIAQSYEQHKLQLIVNLRSCIAGQILLQGGACFTCNSGLYSLSPKSKACKECISTTVCYGGSKISPIPGYWRANQITETIYLCYNRAACIGSTEQNYSPTGHCHPNYTGKLCASCINGYERNSSFECSKCPPIWENLMILVIIFLVFVAFLVFMIRSTIISMQKQKSIFTVYFKIITNHLQLVALLYSFDLDWPDQISKVLKIATPAANVSSELFSIDCLLYYLDLNFTSPFYAYLLISSLLPFFIIFIVMAIWFCKYRKNKKLFGERSISSIIIILFFIHPSIANIVFQHFM